MCLSGSVTGVCAASRTLSTMTRTVWHISQSQRRRVVTELPAPQFSVRAVVPIHVAIGVGDAGLWHPIP